MNCLWLLVLLCCSRNRYGYDDRRGNCNEKSNNCSVNRSICGGENFGRCDCESERRVDNDCECERRRERDTDCGCERRTYIPFGNQTCSCENGQNQS